MGKTASQDKKVLGQLRKRRQDTDLLRRHQLLHKGHSAEEDAHQGSVYEMLQIVSVSLTDTTPLRDLFGKPNYNIVNELDDYSEPTLFDF